MIPGYCSHPDRLPARVFALVAGTDCPCCAYWRGVLSGVLVAGLAVYVAWLGGYL